MNVKKLLVALCLVVCMASAAFCIDPFKVNPDGFGPKIKGVQLGQKMSLLDIVLWRAQFKGFPFILELKGINDPSYIHIKFSGKGMELEGFEIINSTGNFINFQNQDWILDDLLSKFEEDGNLKVDTLNQEEKSEGLISYENNINYYYTPNFSALNVKIVFNENDKDRRIRTIQFRTNDFGAESLTDEEFIQMFTNAYNDIPQMSIKKGVNGRYRYISGEYRNISQGWQVTYDGQYSDAKHIVINPLITQTSFN